MNNWALSSGALLPSLSTTLWNILVTCTHYWFSASFINIGTNGSLYQNPQIHFLNQIQNYPSQFHQGHLAHKQPINATKQVPNQ